jgi:hypothetical protein
LKNPVRADKVPRLQGTKEAAMKTIVDAWWTLICGRLTILTLILWAAGALFDA